MSDQLDALKFLIKHLQYQRRVAVELHDPEMILRMNLDLSEAWKELRKIAYQGRRTLK